MRQIRLFCGQLGLLLVAAVICPAQVTFTGYPVPNNAKLSEWITTGPDGNLWFIDGQGFNIFRMTPAGVVTGQFAISCNGTYTGAHYIIKGPDGNLWFPEYFCNQIGRITPAGVITEFPIPSGGTFPVGITAGPDGNLWFAEYLVNRIGRITPTGVVTEFSVPSGGSYGASGITAGPDGNLWFTECRCSSGASGPTNIGRITPAGTIMEFPVPTGGSAPDQITAGPDGSLWFTETLGNKIAKITTAGVVTEYAIPTAASGPAGITTGSDGNVWFAEHSINDALPNPPNKIGRITPTGVITEFFVTAGDTLPYGITTGPDGNLWITDGNNIVKATIPNTPPGTLTIYPATGGNAGSVTVQIFGSGFQNGTTVKLTGVGADIIGSNVNVANSSVLTTTFSLSGAAIGVRNIVVTNPDRTSATLPNGFTVEQGGAPQLWANVIGRNVIRIGAQQTFYVSYGNRGNADALGTKLLIYFPTSVAPDLTLGNTNGVVSTVTQGTTTIAMINIGRVPAGSTSFIPVTLTAGDGQAPFQVRVHISGH